MYRFIKRAVANIGVGVSDKAFARPRPPSIDSIYGPAYNVQKQVVTTAGGYMLISGRVVPVAITGNGAMPNGSPLLQPLAEESE